jgi:hypothetical protein
VGVPLRIRKFSKMAFSQSRIRDKSKYIEFKITQIINVIKSFVLLRLESRMMNTIQSKTEQSHIDKYIRI